MKIGLIRHFKVKYKFPNKLLLNASELIKCFDEYELAQVEHNTVDLRGVTWEKCFTSPLQRANKTTDAIFTGEIIQVNELKELDLLPLLNKKIRLPVILWAIIIQIKSSSSNHITDEFRKRISAFADILLQENNKHILIVSHGFVMMFLQKELIKRGFRGDTFKLPGNGKIYLFENKAHE